MSFFFRLSRAHLSASESREFHCQVAVDETPALDFLGFIFLSLDSPFILQSL